jgi:hypothetical protein
LIFVKGQLAISSHKDIMSIQANMI